MSVEDREAGRLAGLREARAYVRALAEQVVDANPNANGQRRMAARILNGLELLMLRGESLADVEGDLGPRFDLNGRFGG